MSASSADQPKASLAPQVSRTTRVLILGSLPGEKSLAQQQYYAHPRNLFWKLAGRVIVRDDLPSLSYEERVRVLVENRIGLWDVVGSAKRQGSLDSAIRDVEANPVAELCESLPLLRAVAFNGLKAAQLGRRLVDKKRYEVVTLTSSSPANAATPYDYKLMQWLELRKFLPPILSPQIVTPMERT